MFKPRHEPHNQARGAASADLPLPDILPGLWLGSCSGKIALAEPAGCFVYRVCSFLWHLELRKTSYFDTFFKNALKIIT